MPKPVIDLIWPAGGLNRRYGYGHQPPFTTPEALNVRPDAAMEGRMRGGSRPGLVKAFLQHVGARTTSIVSAVAAFDAAMVGYYVSFVMGSSYRIVEFITDTNVYVDGDASHESGAFIIPNWTGGAGDAVEATLLEGRSGVRMLSTVHIPNSEGRVVWEEPFDVPWDDAEDNEWSHSGDVFTRPFVGGNGLAIAMSGEGERGAIRHSLEMDDQAVADGRARYSVSLTLLRTDVEDPFGNEYVGNYSIFARVPKYWQPNDPNASLAGAVQLEFSDTPETLPSLTIYHFDSASVRHFVAGDILGFTPADHGVLKLEVLDDTRVVATWDGISAVEAEIPGWDVPGTRVGFSLEVLHFPYTAKIDNFAVDYLSPDKVWQHPQRAVVVSAGSRLYRESGRGTMLEVPTEESGPLSGDRPVMAVEHQGKLYIADGRIKHTGFGARYDTARRLTTTPPTIWKNLAPGIVDGDRIDLVFHGEHADDSGTFSCELIEAAPEALKIVGGPGLMIVNNTDYEIYQAPKVYDPAEGTLSIWESTNPSPADVVPTRCSLIARFMARIILAGDFEFPFAWYGSKMGDAHNYNYGAAISGDIKTAIASTTAELSMIGEPITALIAFGDDYLIFGCSHSIWVQRGDPMLTLIGPDNISRAHGIVGAQSSCLLPDGTLIFLSRNGLFAMPPGGAGLPQSLSSNNLPREFMDINPEQTAAVLGYDSSERAVHISLTAGDGSGGQQFWYGLDTNSFWPVNHVAGHVPLAMLPYLGSPSGSGHLLLGCNDGFVRNYSRSAGEDDGIPFVSDCWYGPIALGGGDHMNGLAQEIVGILAEDSGDVRWSLHVGNSAEAAKKAGACATGVWTAGRNYAAKPNYSGVAMYLKVGAAASRPWAVENITLQRKPLGRALML